jgi:prepilin-type N-terminal cleavage/methylation domain-containing protein
MMHHGWISTPEDGFTLPEVLVSSMILVIIVSSTTIVYLMSQYAWQEGSVQTLLEMKASSVMEKMIRGAGSIYGIREAKAINTPGVTPPGPGPRLRYTHTSGINREFFLNSNEIMYDPNVATFGGETAIYDPNPDESPSVTANYSTQLQFERLTTQRVRITLVLGQRVRSKWIYVPVSTDVTIRN